MKQILNRLFEHQYLNRTEAKEILTSMADGKYNDSEIAAFNDAIAQAQETTESGRLKKHSVNLWH